MFIPGEVLIHFHASGWFLLHNPFAKTFLAVDHGVLAFMRSLQGGESCSEPEGDIGQLREVAWYSNEQGLLADPTRLHREEKDWGQVEELDQAQLLARLKKHCMVADDPQKYRARFGPKASLLDFEHFGNFHQQHGQQLLALLRRDPEDWWFRQKFSDDLQSIRNNLYHAVQEKYLERYFQTRLRPGGRVVDLGCGIGYYANMMARQGLEVLAVDPNTKYLEIASANGTGGARFELMNVGTPGGLDAIEDGFADYVFMSDALLFYFVPERPSQKADIQILFRDILRILKPGGVFISLEPHPVFWLQPWLGEENHPFTVVQEYRHRKFSVAPGWGEMVKTFCEGGFVVSWYDELYADPNFWDTDPRAYHFAAEFPLWHLFELTRREG